MDQRLHHTPGNVLALKRSRRVPFVHMGPADTRVWKAAIEERLFEADRYEYDVRLAGVTPDTAEVGVTHAVMWEALTKKRIDVVAWRGRQAWILEVKPVASFAALGQCLGYGFLWERERPEARAVRLGVVCAICDRDLKPCFEAFGVSVFELPPDVAEGLLAHQRHGAADIST